MKFECGDLDRAFANPDLMPEARAHIKTCAACRQEFQLWREISSTAQQLHQEWDTPVLWPQIRLSLQAEEKQAARPFGSGWKTWAVAATLLVTTGFAWLIAERHQTLSTSRQTLAAASQDFLTEQALLEVEKNEAAYRKSIDQLMSIAEPKLQNSASPSAVNTREKLLMLDTAITDTRTNIATNRFNLNLQTTLAVLYREKQQTLKELLTSDKNN